MLQRRRALTVLTAAMIFAGCSSSGGVTVRDRQPAVSAVDETNPDDTSPTETSPPGTDPSNGDGSIEWGRCDDPLAEDETLECATLTVPLDHTAPTGDTLDIALVRAPATASREGAVLFNPGGPGGSGFDPIAVSGTTIQSSLGLEHFDIVGFDPRGVDRSGGIKCVDDAFQDRHLYLDDTPDTPEEQALLDEEDQGFVDGCKQRYGDTLKFYSTENTARDMDLIRAGLGDEQISYLGISYGTYLGATYATLFPDRVRAMVLDSAYEPNGDTVEQQFLTQLVGFEEAFNNWAAWCASNADCPFTTAEVGARWDALRQRLDDQPIAGADGRLANQATLDTATGASLYSESDWPVLADALVKAESGDPSGIFALADAYAGRNEDGTFNTLFQSIGIIQCASGIEPAVPDDPAAILAQAQAKAPRFSKGATVDDLTEGGNCDQLTGVVQPVQLSYEGDGPIVVVGGTNDPATPIRWAEEMTAALGPNARLVTYTGEGHGQLLVSTCVTDIEAAVLADLALPDKGTVCEPDPKVERPNWWDELPTPAGFSEPVSLPAVNAALGLRDTLGYGETRTTSLDAQAAVDALDAALVEAGFQSLGSQDLGIDDTVENGYFSPDGDLLLVIAMGPAAFDTEALSSAKPTVPAGQTVVLLAYLPQ